MDFDLANQYAKEILGGKDDQYQSLVKMSFGYLCYLRKKFGFYSISKEEIKEELAFCAVSDAIMAQQRRGLPFSICIQNTFRDLCRKNNKIDHDRYRQHIISQFKKFPSPPACAQDKELVELATAILNDHEELSKKVVYQKIRGSTYPEMADIFKKELNECKRVYWHDIKDLIKKMNPNPEEK